MPSPVAIPQENYPGALPFGLLTPKALALVRSAHAGVQLRGVAGVPTGLPQLDEKLGGLQTGLHILGAAPGAGKTARALTIACHAATVHQLPVIYCSCDEVPERLALKVLASRCGLSMSDMANGRIDPATVEVAIQQHGGPLHPLSFMALTKDVNAAGIIEQLTARMQQLGQSIGLVVVDYLQPWAGALASSMNADFRIAVGLVALELRRIANETGCPVLLISAQNREGQGSAGLGSLRESSDLEYGADSVTFLTEAPADVQGAALLGTGKYLRRLSFGKNRFGPAGGSVDVVLDGRAQVVTEFKR
jgi:replicative DNA helicase